MLEPDYVHPDENTKLHRQVNHRYREDQPVAKSPTRLVLVRNCSYYYLHDGVHSCPYVHVEEQEPVLGHIEGLWAES